MLTAVTTNNITSVHAQKPQYRNQDICLTLSQPVLRCGMRWGITNNDVIGDYWKIHELRFYWDKHCTAEITGTPKSESPLDYQYEDTAGFAFDGKLDTAWTSNNQYAMGGAQPRIAGASDDRTTIYKELPDDETLDIEMVPYNSKNVTQIAAIGCVKIWQSDETVHQSLNIGVVFWTGLVWQEHATMDHMGGNGWQFRPPYKNTVWRVMNLDQTKKAWEVSELSFFADRICGYKAEGTPVGNAASKNLEECMAEGTCDENSIVKMADGDLDTGYRATCQQPVAPDVKACTLNCPCYPLRAFIGYDFGNTPQEVHCMKMYQTPHQGYYQGFMADVQHTESIRLEVWDGYAWSFQKDVSGLVPDKWYYDYAPAKTLWRLVADSLILDGWHVGGIEFYENPYCDSPYDDGKIFVVPSQRQPLEGKDSFDSNVMLGILEQAEECDKPKSSCANHAFDNDPQTVWMGDCTHTACARKTTYIGQYFNLPKDVLCYKIMQESNPKLMVSTLELSKWDGAGGWEMTLVENNLGGGSWNRRPTNEYSMWRLVNAVDTKWSWRIHELKFYKNTECTDELEDASPITSAASSLNPVEGAFDIDETDPEPGMQTFWESNCGDPMLPTMSPCPRFSSWIGIQRAKTNPAVLKAEGVRCVRIVPSRDALHQSAKLQLETWNGLRWLEAPEEIIPGGFAYEGYGGGTFDPRPGQKATKWRLRAPPGVLTYHAWKINGLEFFSDDSCKATEKLNVDYANVRPIASGYAMGYELVALKQRNEAQLTLEFGSDGMAEDIEEFVGFVADNAFDSENEASYWVDVQDKQDKQDVYDLSGFDLWIGLDLGNAPNLDCGCFRIKQDTIFMAHTVELEYWDGKNWAQIDFGINQSWTIGGLSGGSWMHWPAKYQTIWLLRNGDPILSSWQVDEFAFYDNVGCEETPLQGEVIVSGYRGSAMGNLAVDGIVRYDTTLAADKSVIRYLDNYWESGCGPCQGGQAYIGMDFGWERKQVKCFRLVQSNMRRHQSATIDLDFWDGDSWKMNARYYGLGGGSWNRRPAAANTMWRMRYRNRKSEPCAGLRKRQYERSWGVSEVVFYYDDHCRDPIRIANGGREVGDPNSIVGNRGRNLREAVISSGYRALASQGMVNYDYYTNNVADGNFGTIWAADCGSEPNSFDVNCDERDWIGMDFGSPKIALCVKVSQARNDQRECCDVADQLTLDRWDGTNWVISKYRHEPQDGGDNLPVIVTGLFQAMGVCGLENNIEKRSRRESEECKIPLSSVTKTLGHPLCIRHQWCDEIGFQGTCCPYMDGPEGESKFNSRCCCGYMASVKIFVDEIPLEERGQTYDKLDLEYVAIQWTKLLPWYAVVLATIFFLTANLQEPEDEDSWLHIYWERHTRSLQEWLRADGYAQRALHYFIWQPADTPAKKGGKMAAVLLMAFILGGSLIWVIGGWILSVVFLKVMFLCVRIIKYSKSRYFPGHEFDEIRRFAITKVAINDDVESKYPEGLGLIKTFMAVFVGGFISMLRWCLDLMLMRQIFFLLNVGDNRLSSMEILDHFPRVKISALDGVFSQLVTLMTWLIQVWPLSYQEILMFFFNGIPRCKGPSLLFSSMIYLGIALANCKFLNYDYFALYAGAKDAVSTTKPTCQKNVTLGLIFAFESFVFAVTQCSLLTLQLFKDLALPGEQKWMCPWSDVTVELVAMVLLYIFIITTFVTVLIIGNGHFLGQDYIIRPLAKTLGWNLDRLDPDGTGPEGGMINIEILFAMVPSTIGVWRDDWNVPAFLLLERAKVYSEELRTPHRCPLCDEIHVPYMDVIRAQAKTLSLAYQALPLGLIFGKMTEYSNNPPLLYRGRLMLCLGRTKHSLKKEYAKIGVLLDWWIPLGQKSMSVFLYFWLIFAVLWMTSENVESTGIIVMAVALCGWTIKSFFHLMAPELALAYEGHLIAKAQARQDAADRAMGKKVGEVKLTDQEIRRKEKEKLLKIEKPEMPKFRILFAHCMHGILPGCFLGSYGVASEFITSVTLALWMSMFVSIFTGYFPIYLFYRFELGHSMLTFFFVKVAYCGCILIGLFLYLLEIGYTKEFSLTTSVAAFTFLLIFSCLCFHRRLFDSQGMREPSLLHPILFTYKGLPHYLAIVSSLFVSIIPASFLIIPEWNPEAQTVTVDGITITKEWRNVDDERSQMGYLVYGLFVFGMGVAILITYLVAEQLSKRPVIYAITISYTVTLILQPFMFFGFVLPIAIICGLGVGCWLENREVERILGINLHDKVLQYGDLRTAKSAASRVKLQEAQKKQIEMIKEAIDENRPVLMPGTGEIVGEINLDDEHQEVLALPPIQSVAELVAERGENEEEVLRDAKVAQAKSALQFSKTYREVKKDERVRGDKLESWSSIAQENSKNPNRSLVINKQAMVEQYEKRKQRDKLHTRALKDAARHMGRGSSTGTDPEPKHDTAKMLQLALEEGAADSEPRAAQVPKHFSGGPAPDVVRGEENASPSQMKLALVGDSMKRELGLGADSDDDPINWGDSAIHGTAAQSLPANAGNVLATGKEADRWQYDPDTNLYFDPVSAFHYNPASGEYLPPGSVNALPNQMAEAGSLALATQNENVNVAPMSSYFRTSATFVPPPQKVKAMSLGGSVQRKNFHKKTLEDTCLGPMARGNRGANPVRTDYNPQSTTDPNSQHQFY
jgi:hypothetical protein